jgi:hypothetical protein
VDCGAERPSAGVAAKGFESPPAWYNDAVSDASKKDEQRAEAERRKPRSSFVERIGKARGRRKADRERPRDDEDERR